MGLNEFLSRILGTKHPTNADRLIGQHAIVVETIDALHATRSSR